MKGSLRTLSVRGGNVRAWLEQKDANVPGVPSVPITTDHRKLVHSIPLTDPPVLLVHLVHLVQIE